MVDQVKAYRETGDKSIKAKLPACTPGGLYTTETRVKGTEISRTGLLTFDIDGKDNRHIKDWSEVRQKLHDAGFVIFSALSTSAKGVYGIIKISDPYQQKKHYEQLEYDLKQLFDLTLDSTKGKNCNDLRIYSYDPNALVNLDAEVYDRKKEDEIKFTKLKSFRPKIDSPKETVKKVKAVIQRLQDKHIDLNPTGDYATYRALAWAFCDTSISPHNRDLFHQAMSTHSKYSYNHSDREFIKLQKRYRPGKTTIATFFKLAKDNGINLGEVYKENKI